MSANVHSVFFASNADDRFSNKIKLSHAKEKQLRSARDQIREHLAAEFRNWRHYVKPDQLLTEAYRRGLPDQSALRPKFRMQGSLAYATCIYPDQVPPQQVDVDDGLFLPVSYLREAGEDHPAILVGGLFEALEKMLQPLCDKNGWELDEPKDNCIRILLDGDQRDAHVDLTIYSVPDRSYAALARNFRESHSVEIADRMLRDDHLELLQEAYNALNSNEIMLATRTGWRPSDPRKLEEWFREAVNRYGEQLRRVCRYLKGLLKKPANLAIIGTCGER